LGFEFCVREPSEKRLIAAGNHTSLVARFSEPRFHSKPKTRNPKLKTQSAKHKTQNPKLVILTKNPGTIYEQSENCDFWGERLFR
jgi:hypothetical protein